MDVVYAPRRCEEQGCNRVMPSYDHHLRCVACLGGNHSPGTCLTCQQIPEPILSLRKRAMIVKNKIDKEDGWKEAFFKEFSDLQARSDDESGPGSHLVSVSIKRKSDADGGQGSKRQRPSAALGVNPNRDEAEVAVEDIQDGGGDDRSHEVAPSSDKERLKHLEQLVTGLQGKIQSLKRVNDLREQQDMFDEDEEVKGKLSALEKREVCINILKALTPGVQFPEQAPQPDDDSPSHFKALMPKQASCVNPFCEPLLLQIASFSKPPAKGSRQEPFKLIDKYYRTIHDVEQSLLKPRFVPASLLNEVPKTLLSADGASGAEARLHKESPNGQKEIAALRDLRQASSFLRLVNSQELGLQGVTTLFTRVTQRLDQFKDIANVPTLFTDAFDAMRADLTSVNTLMEDIMLANASMARGVSYQYVEATRERRKAWLDSANLPSGLKAELGKSPLDLFQAGNDEPLSLLSPRYTKLIQEHVANRKDDVYRTVAAKLSNQNKPQYAKNKNKKGNQQQGKRQQNLDWNELSPAAQAAGWSTGSQSKRGKGRRNQGGRPKAQPFSANTASTDKK
jgi:hypothetical protein